MARQGITISVTIDGARAVLQAFNELPRDANVALKDGTAELIRELVPKVKAAGFAEGSQAARVATTVKGRRDRLPVIVAGGGRASSLVFGSEFGMKRRSGWYAAPRYRISDGRQYKPWIGAGSYWFFKTVEDNDAQIAAKWLEVADKIARGWAT